MSRNSLSSLPGHAPIQDGSCFADGNAAAFGTDFRDDLLRGIDTTARHLGQALHRIVVVSEQLRHLLIELGGVVFDHAQFIFFDLALNEPLSKRASFAWA
jgi:hypothetical protein